MPSSSPTPSATKTFWPTPTSSAEVDLVAARRAAGIEDCPQPAGEPIEDGLPELTLECLGGDITVSLGALRGPTVVNLWAHEQFGTPIPPEDSIRANPQEAAADRQGSDGS